jgi:transcriptional regulator with XRE-family HTH domain
LISIPQIRAARGLLGWSQTRLAEKAGLSLPTVKRYETTSALKVSDQAITAMQAALEAAGVIFVPGNGEGPGVRLKKEPAATVAAVDQKIEALEGDLASERFEGGLSPQAAMQTLERARKKNEVVALKNKRTTMKKRR